MNVILIDDEEVAVNALKRRVDWKKYGVDEVYVAYSEGEAQKLFQEKVIDVMFSDIEMPQGSGLELFAWVKQNYPEVECVYVSCHPEFEYMRKAIQLGTTDYILKPIDHEEFGKILAKLAKRVRRRHRMEAIPSEIMQEGPDKSSERRKDDVVGAVKRYVREHIKEDIYIADIAKQVYLTEQYLMRSFNKITGISILEFITRERIWLAKELLIKTNYPIKQVADSVGYGNYTYFTKIFKRNTGMTPNAFREKYAKTETPSKDVPQ